MFRLDSEIKPLEKYHRTKGFWLRGPLRLSKPVISILGTVCPNGNPSGKTRTIEAIFVGSLPYPFLCFSLEIISVMIINHGYYNIPSIQPFNKYLLNGLMGGGTQCAIPLRLTEHNLKTLLQLNLLMVKIRNLSEKGKCPKSSGYKVAKPGLGARTSYQKDFAALLGFMVEWLSSVLYTQPP